jgi:acetyl-CoA synthetase
MTPPTRIANWSFDPVSIKWYEDGQLNLCHNSIDRHVAAGHGDRIAILFEPDSPDAPSRSISYAALLADVIRMANTLKKMGVQKGDRVTIYMPMVPEGAVAMLACARIGAIHSVIFGGFSPEAIAGRIEDCASDWVICADEGLRGGKTIPLKANVDAALEKISVKAVLVIAHTGGDVGRCSRRLSLRSHGGRGPSVHPLYFGLHRQTKGSGSHHRRLFGMDRRDFPLWI